MTVYDLAMVHKDIPLNHILAWLKHEHRVRKRRRNGHYYIIPGFILIRLALWDVLYFCGICELVFGKPHSIPLTFSISIASSIFRGMEFLPW
jgi:hypothetical protein